MITSEDICRQCKHSHSAQHEYVIWCYKDKNECPFKLELMLTKQNEKQFKTNNKKILIVNPIVGIAIPVGKYNKKQLKKI